MKNLLKVMDREDVLLIAYEDMVKYHGRMNIGGVALAYKVLEYAFSRLSPHTPPRREMTEIFTAFPGSGVIDGFEMVTRAVTQGRFQLDEAYDEPRALAGTSGRFYFRVTYAGTPLALAPKAGLVPEAFLAMGRKIKAGQATAEDKGRFQEMKESLAAALMGLKAEEVFDEL